jgi:hypothetical protein
MQRSSRCFAEPGPSRAPSLARPRLCSAPLRKGYALRCVRGTRDYNTASTAFAMSAVPLLPPNSIGLMPSA